MNSILERNICEADGRYFTDAELKLLEQYHQTYETRLRTYSILCKIADRLIAEALKEFSKTEEQTVAQYSNKCIRDMSYLLRYVALAILRDDEQAFREQVLLWMQNIMSALHKESQSAQAYRILRTVIRQTMPAENASLVNYYLDAFIASLTAGL